VATVRAPGGFATLSSFLTGAGMEGPDRVTLISDRDLALLKHFSHKPVVRRRALFLRSRHSARATRVPSLRRHGPCRASTLGHRLLATSVGFSFARGGTAFLAFGHCAVWISSFRLRES
jgi:hypothetical protein